ncbi:hypothetical protein D3C78_1606630 [compost metagenome]
MLASQTTHTFAFCAHHQCQTASHFTLINGMIGFTRRTDDPDILFLKLAHSARQIGHADQRNVFRCAAGHFFRCRIQLRCTISWNDYRMHTCCIGTAQTRAEVVGIGHAVEDQEERVIQLGN